MYTFGVFLCVPREMSRLCIPPGASEHKILRQSTNTQILTRDFSSLTYLPLHNPNNYFPKRYLRL